MKGFVLVDFYSVDLLMLRFPLSTVYEARSAGVRKDIPIEIPTSDPR